jgi:putative nucleotidyltransferase with HDIG domain
MPLTLSDLIPELNEIQDHQLRDKVQAVWEDALDQGSWELDDLKDLPYTLLIEDVTISFPEHVSVVARLCLAVESVLQEAYSDRYEIDRDILLAGALLADVGKLIEFTKSDDQYEWAPMYSYLRHPFTGVGLCFKHDLPEAVMHIVATHSWEGDKFTRKPESIIFHHADFIDFDLTKYDRQ